MTKELTFSALGLIAFCIVAETGRELCYKHAAIAGADGIRWFFHPVTLLGIGLWFVELVVWSRVLGQTPLSVAFPIMAASYATIPLASAVLFRETVTYLHAIGVVLVTAGVVCVGCAGV